jgi:hypothetical protein
MPITVQGGVGTQVGYNSTAAATITGTYTPASNSNVLYVLLALGTSSSTPSHGTFAWTGAGTVTDLTAGVNGSSNTYMGAYRIVNPGTTEGTMTYTPVAGTVTGLMVVFEVSGADVSDAEAVDGPEILAAQTSLSKDVATVAGDLVLCALKCGNTAALVEGPDQFAPVENPTADAWQAALSAKLATSNPTNMSYTWGGTSTGRGWIAVVVNEDGGAPPAASHAAWMLMMGVG